MSMSVILVLASIVFTRNLVAIESQDPGFDRQNMVMFGIRPGTSGYEKSRLPALYSDLEQRLAAIPGVTGAGLASVRPMNVGGWWEEVRLPGHSEVVNVSANGITPTYLPLYTGRVLAGRNLSQADVATGARVVVISEDLARKLGGTALPGRRLEFVDGPPGSVRPQYEIVGIVPAIAATSLKNRPYVVWLPFTNETPEATVVLRTAALPSAVMPAVRQAMNELDHNLPLVDVMTMEQQMSKGLQRERMFAMLCTGFGILALLLSVIGLYGLFAYTTSRRRGEIGVRLALGAMPGDVLAMLVREGMTLVVAGIFAAGPAVVFGARYVERELFQMRPLEVSSVALALSILLGASLAAIAVPALRAAALEPSQTLRHD